MWLIAQAKEDKWSKEEVAWIAWGKNKEGTLAMSQLDVETQRQVAFWSPEETNKNGHLCSLEFIRWLINQAKEDKWSKEEVASIAWRENKDGALIISQLDFETQTQMAFWNQEGTNKNAHLLSLDIIQWLITQAKEDKWSKEEVGSIICRKNKMNQLLFKMLDKEVQKEVALFNPAMTCSALPFIEEHFLRWLYKEAAEGKGGWDQQVVFKVLRKEEVDGETIISSRIKPGNFFWKPHFM